MMALPHGVGSLWDIFFQPEAVNPRLHISMTQIILDTLYFLTNLGRIGLLERRWRRNVQKQQNCNKAKKALWLLIFQV